MAVPTARSFSPLFDLATGFGVRRLELPALSLLGLHQANPRRYPFLLQSGAGCAGHGRFDILFAFPGAHLALESSGLHGTHPPGETDFLRALDRWYGAEARAASPPRGLPFGGGWFLYLGYELAGQIEPTLDLAPAPPGLPTALAVRCRGALLRDRRDQGLWAIAETDDLAAELVADATRAPAWQAPAFAPVPCHEDHPAAYLDGVRTILEYIRAGDIFQVNLARAWRATLPAAVAPCQLYAALRRANPAPFSGLMRWGEAAVISSSPERLLHIQDGRAQTRPIAGTRPRRGEDGVITRELLAHPKERAEHVMLIDLERNDLGRVCRYGSIRVDELMVLESYAHVHHIVSNISGRLRPEVGPGAALRAVFPGGTITGCPKVRCMEIIAELEVGGRGAYTGAFGYLGLDGRLDSNILIRSLIQHGRDLTFKAGAGIVADSDPHQELEETRAKARGLLLALAGSPPPVNPLAKIKTTT